MLSTQVAFAESHAAAIKHSVATVEKAMGRMKRYLQLTTVKAAEQRHERMLRAGEAAKKEALTRDGHFARYDQRLLTEPMT
jgi:hypothetical protein